MILHGCLLTAEGAHRTISIRSAISCCLIPDNGLSKLPSQQNFSTGIRLSAPTPFRIIDLEKWVYTEIGGMKVGGIIDRLDSIYNPETGEDHIRVIDYKTGSRHIKPLPDVASIFTSEAIKDHSDYFLQTFLYAHIVRSKSSDSVSPCLMFIQHAGGKDYDPTLGIGRETVADIATYSDEFISLFQNLLAEIFNPQLSFTPTDDRKRCETCPFASLCRG